MIDLTIESLRSGDFRATARHHGTTIAWRDASTAKAALLAVLSEACRSHRCGNGKYDMTHLQPNAEALAIMAEAGLIQAEAAGPVAGGADARSRAIEALKAEQGPNVDKEEAHMQADKVLCSLLAELGFADVVAEWEKVGKWYA